MSQVPPGWYADPYDGSLERWWDGSAWSTSTRHTAASTAAVPATMMAAPAAGSSREAPGQQWSQGGPGAWSGAPTGAPTTDPLAIVALVAGLLWVVGIGSVVAIVCGIVVLRRGAEGTSRTLAIVGLVLGGLGLLPALIVLGVLGAIAMPVFLQQQDAALEAQLHSDLRNAAVAQESVFTRTGSYTTDLRELEGGATGSFSSDVAIVRADGRGYCLEATNDQGVAHYDSGPGGVADGPCP